MVCSQWRLRISVTKLLFPITIFAFAFFRKWYLTFPHNKLQLRQSKNYIRMSCFNCLNLVINSSDIQLFLISTYSSGNLKTISGYPFSTARKWYKNDELIDLFHLVLVWSYKKFYLISNHQRPPLAHTVVSAIHVTLYSQSKTCRGIGNGE